MKSTFYVVSQHVKRCLIENYPTTNKLTKSFGACTESKPKIKVKRCRKTENS